MHKRDAWLARLGLVMGLAACALAPLGRESGATSRDSQAAPEWPVAWEGRPLRPLALGAFETRFAARFPGHIARMTDGERTLVLREVCEPTRMLHPAADCYRAIGYSIAEAHLERDERQQLWRCFIAERGGQRLRVCERIVDARGEAFTDASSWFWAAALGQSTGPWRAVTIARAL
jgi:hypothetical protein